jgi:hypothetical protein
MSWRAITTDDVLDAVDNVSSTAFRTALLAVGQDDPAVPVIEQVTGYVRDAIRSNKDNTLDPDGTTMPEGCIWKAVDIIIYRLARRLGRVLKPTEDMKESMLLAEKYFEQVARGTMAVEQFGQEPDVTAPEPGPRINSRGRNFTRTTQDGI